MFDGFRVKYLSISIGVYLYLIKEIVKNQILESLRNKKCISSMPCVSIAHILCERR
jgi:hypothetical protein